MKEAIDHLGNKYKTLGDMCQRYGIPAEIEARKKQYEYYREKLLTFKKLEK